MKKKKLQSKLSQAYIESQDTTFVLWIFTFFNNYKYSIDHLLYYVLAVIDDRDQDNLMWNNSMKDLACYFYWNKFHLTQALLVSRSNLTQFKLLLFHSNLYFHIYANNFHHSYIEIYSLFVLFTIYIFTHWLVCLGNL